MRIGHGYDAHRFGEGRELVLGGVKIEYEKGLVGHSDADVLIHAVMDALIGAMALGDIGKHFPESDKEYLGISSIELLKKTRALMFSEGYDIVNLDATLILERPKIAKYVEEMRKNIAEVLECSVSCVNIKATTEEKMGFTGSGDGASAHAVVLIEKG
ncbi:MAG: 2-C-methyl-D-erythritol 2,4-cyclodiphosphate synthase [Clostridia bacterium]|nr:2-C-methyl-D-erythritol 2,4-cyclodiphosphate synthase [Clostridia bacterium]